MENMQYINSTLYDYVQYSITNIEIMKKLSPSYADIMIKAVKGIIKKLTAALKYAQNYLKDRLTNIIELMVSVVTIFTTDYENSLYDIQSFQKFLYIINLSLSNIKQLIVHLRL